MAPRSSKSTRTANAESVALGLGRFVGGLRSDPAEAGDRSQCARTAHRDKIMGTGRGDAHSRREGHAGCVFCSVGSVSRRNSARARLRPAESDRPCAANQPRDARGVASNTRRRRQARHRRRRLSADARRHWHGKLCPPAGLRQDGAVSGSHRCARAVAAAGLAVAGLRSAHRGSRQRGPDPACRQSAVQPQAAERDIRCAESVFRLRCEPRPRHGTGDGAEGRNRSGTGDRHPQPQRPRLGHRYAPRAPGGIAAAIRHCQCAT